MSRSRRRNRAVNVTKEIITLSQVWRQDCRDFLVHQFFGCRINLKDISVPGFHSAVEDDGWLQPYMKPMHRLLAAMDIGGRFESGKKCPEKFLEGTGRGNG